MTERASFTLTEIARKLEVPQHRLIHLCEKDVVIPEVHDASGRGSSRGFSPRNYLELAVALRLRDMFVPVTVLRGVMHVLRKFGDQIGNSSHGDLVRQLRRPNSPELQIILSDGQLLYFLLRRGAETPRLFGGIPLQALSTDDGELNDGRPQRGGHQTRSNQQGEFGGPENSQFARLELSVTAVARSLELD
jgi:hypothetical protein